MKKPLLFLGSLALAACASALTPEIYPNTYSQHLSPNGRYFASSAFGSIMVVDTETGESYEWESESAIVGNGNALTDDGILVGGPDDTEGSVFVKGEWLPLGKPEGVYSCFPQAITSDGQYIAGYANTYSSNIIQIPVVWKRAQDGSYGDFILLPYPELDPVTNLVPQYILPVCMSDDGNHIFGQIVHETGMFIIPIEFVKDEKDKWGYRYPCLELFNPIHLELPEDPGDFTEPYVTFEDYMTQEELDAYYDAVNEYYETPGGSWPDFSDFMTPEEVAEYNKAAEAYNEKAAAYNEKFEAYMDVLTQIVADSPSLMQNQVACSADGKIAVFNAQKVEGEDFFSRKTSGCPLEYDATTGTGHLWDPALDVYCHTVLDDGTLSLNTYSSPWAVQPIKAFIRKGGETELIPLQDYLIEQDPAIEEWINKNLVHEYTSYDDDWNELISEGISFGIPSLSSDLTTIITTCTCNWNVDYDDEEDVPYYYTYRFSGLTSGVENVAADAAELTVQSLGKGELAVSGPATVEIYNFNGTCIYKGLTIGGTLSTGVVAGVYVVKATAMNGATTVAKLTF